MRIRHDTTLEDPKDEDNSNIFLGISMDGQMFVSEIF